MSESTQTAIDIRNKTHGRFPMAVPHKWRNLTTNKTHKVLPWFQPLDKSSEFDFMGLMKEVFPEFGEDVMRDFQVYKGLCLQAGWMILGEGGVWVCVPPNYKESFEDMGVWHEEVDGRGELKIPRKKAKKKKAKKKK